MVIETKSRETATAQIRPEPQTAHGEGLTLYRAKELRERIEEGPSVPTHTVVGGIASQLWGYFTAIDGWIGGKPASQLERQNRAQLENESRNRLGYLPF